MASQFYAKPATFFLVPKLREFSHPYLVALQDLLQLSLSLKPGTRENRFKQEKETFTSWLVAGLMV